MSKYMAADSIYIKMNFVLWVTNKFVLVVIVVKKGKYKLLGNINRFYIYIEQFAQKQVKNSIT